MTAEMAIRGTHDFVLGEIRKLIQSPERMSVLDIGAGAGALSARLKNAGMSVSACDIVPDNFDVAGVECRKCDETGRLPFDDGLFDLAVAVEVLEHIDGHSRFFAEAARVLKPGGLILFTTPNILSLKSRLRFLFTGCYYSFGLLEPFTTNPVGQHITPFSLNRYTWMLSQHGLTVSTVTTDKLQRSSMLLAFLAPFAKLISYLQFGRNGMAQQQNTTTVLFGRKLVIVARKNGKPL